MHPPLSRSIPVEYNKALSPLPAEIQRSLEEVLDRIVELEKEEYHNDLVPFSHREKQIREKGLEIIEELTTSLENGQKVLKELFEREEKEHPEIDPESHYARWEEAAQKLVGLPSLLETLTHTEIIEVPLQQQCGLPWAFMDRAYATANKLQEDKRLADAANIFKLLHHLNPDVFEYWLSEANALFDLGKFKEALEAYERSLLLQPENPLALYQQGCIRYQLGDIENSFSAFDRCIEAAEKDESHKDFVQLAQEAKRFLESKKAA